MTMIVPVAKTLRCSSLFEKMSEWETENVLNLTDYRIVSYGKREVYCVAGTLCRHVDIVLRGYLSVHMVGVSGKMVEVLRLRKGDVIAPCFLFATDGHMPVTIEAESCARVLRIPMQAFQHLLDSHEQIRRNFIRVLSDVASYLTSRIYFLSLLTVREKIVHYLRTEIAVQKSLTITVDRTRRSMAEAFGIQMFSLLRCFSELSASGVIRVTGKTITVLAPERLK